MTRSPIFRAFRFTAAGALVVSAFAGVALGMQRYDVWTAESFGDRRLAAPVADECSIARAVLDQVHQQDQAAWLRRIQASEDDRLVFRAFGWRSNGPHAGRGVDWRACRGLGAHVRRDLGFQPMGHRSDDASLFISRPDFSSGGDAQVYETLYPPTYGRTVPRTWRVSLRKAGGAWRIVGRLPAEPPKG